MVGTVDTWDLDEVCIWLNCIGLGDKVDSFRENTIDGDSLLSLTVDDLSEELGLSKLQVRRTPPLGGECPERHAPHRSSPISISGHRSPLPNPYCSRHPKSARYVQHKSSD